MYIMLILVTELIVDTLCVEIINAKYVLWQFSDSWLSVCNVNVKVIMLMISKWNIGLQILYIQ